MPEFSSWAPEGDRLDIDVHIAEVIAHQGYPLGSPGSTDASDGDHRGTSMPAMRLITRAHATTITASIITARSGSVWMNPSATIIVVAAAGACLKPSQTITPSVRTKALMTAPTRAVLMSNTSGRLG